MAAETVDTRVVEAKFDSKQFEQGVDRTVKKLDELKKSLNLKDTEKSVAEIGNKISETSEKASSSLEKLQERFTSFTGMLKQKLLSGIADEVVGAFFKMENGIKNFVTSLSTGQIGAGMQRYTDILTSVRTLVSAGVDQDTSYKAVERLGDYADQTSYSLDELVSTMSKFKTAGANIDTARRMVEGLSNAAASMGVNVQQASRAYLNLQQAYSKGAMLQNDWISFESLPMVGEKFSQAIIDAAVKVGTLVETTKKGVYQTVKNIDSQVKTNGADAKGITVQNMGTKLSSRWFNKAVMEEVFGNTYYFDAIERSELNSIKETEKRLKAQVKEGRMKQEAMDKELQDELNKLSAKRLSEKTKELDEQLAAGKIKEEDYKKALEDFNKSNVMTVFGYNAFRAGQEARSFNDVLLTLKDTISRGWAKTFEYLFGKLDEAADFFTWLTESNLANAIYAIGDIRNAILEIWAAPGINGSPSGRDNIISGLKTIDELLGSIFQQMNLIEREKDFFNEEHYTDLLKSGRVKEAEEYKAAMEALKNQWEEMEHDNPFDNFVERVSQGLITLSANFNVFTRHVKAFFTSDLVEGETRIQRVEHVFAGIKEAIQIVLIAADDLLKKVIAPLTGSIFKNLEKAIQPFIDLVTPDKYDENGQNIFTKTRQGIDNIINIAGKVVEKVTPIIDILGDVLRFFAEMASDSFYMNIEFLSDALGLVSELLFRTSSQSEAGIGVLDGIRNSIQELGDTCKNVFKAVFDFFDSIIKDIRVLIGLDDGELQEGGLFSNISNWFNNNEALQNVKAKFDEIVKNVGEWLQDLPARIAELPSMVGKIFEGLFYRQDGWRYNGSQKEAVIVPTELKKWLDQAKTDVEAFINDIPNKVASIPSMIGKLFEGLFYRQDGWRYNGSQKEAVMVPTELKKWLDKAKLDVEEFIKKIPEKIKKLPSIVGEFFKKLFYYKTSVANTGKVTWVKKPFTKWIEDNVINNLKEFVKNLPTYIGQAIGTVGDFVGKIVAAIFGKSDGNAVASTEIQGELEKPFLGIDISGILNTVKEIGKKIINGIISVFSGTEDWDTNKNWFADKIAVWINNIRTKAEEIWPKVKEWFIKLPETIASLFNGNSEQTKGESSSIATAISGFGESIGVWISQLPNTLLTAWENAEKELGKLWENIIGWITGDKVADKLNAQNQSIYDQMTDHGDFDTAEMFKKSALEQQWRDENPVAANISDFFTHLAEYFSSKIKDLPNDIKSLFDKVVTIGGILIDVIKGEKKEDYNSPLYNTVADTFETIVTWIKEKAEALPGMIKEAWGTVQTVGSIIGDILFGNDKRPLFDQKRYEGLLNNKSTAGIEGLNERMAEMYKQGTRDYGSPVYNSIAQFFENVRNWIREKIEDLPNAVVRGWNAVLDFGTKIGPTILNGLNTALTWVSEKLSSVTTALTEAHKTPGKSVFDVLKEKMIIGKDENGKDIENPIWTSIRNIGNTIKNLIVVELPKFITEGFEELKRLIPKLINKIFGVGSTSTEGAQETAKQTKKVLERNVNTAIFAPVEEVKDAIDKKIANQSPFLDFNKIMGITSGSTENQNGGFFDSLLQMLGFTAQAEGGTDSKKAADNAKGIMGNLGDIWTSITGFIDKVKTNDTLKVIGIAAVILAVIHELRIILDNMQFIDDIGYTAKWLGFGTLITVFSGILGYMTVLAATAEEGSAEEKKLQRVKQIFVDFKDIIIEILEPIKWILGLSLLKDVVGLVKTFKENSSTVTMVGMESWPQKIFGALLGPLETFANGAASVSGKLVGASIGGQAIGDLIEKLSGSANDALGELGSGLEGMSTYLVTTVDNLKKIMADNGIETAIESIGRIHELVTKAIELLYFNTNEVGWSNADPNTLQKLSVLDYLTDISKMFSRLSGGLSLLKNSVSGYGNDVEQVTKSLGDLLGMHEKMKEFGEFSETSEYQMFKKALAGLGAIFRLYSDSLTKDFNEEPKEINIGNAVNLLEQLFGNEEFIGLINSFNENGLPDVDIKTLDTAENIIIFAGSLASIAKACKDLTGSEDKDINKLVDIVNEIKIGKDASEITSVAEKFGILGNALGAFAAETAGLSDANLTNAERALSMLLRIATGMGSLPADSFFSKLVYGDQTIDAFSVKIAEVGRNLNAFFTSIENVSPEGVTRSYNKQNMEMMLEAFDTMARIGITLSGIKGTPFSSSAFTSFVDTLSAERLGTMATNILAFIDSVTVKDNEGKYKYNADDFAYFDTIIKIVEEIAKIADYVSGLTFDNLGETFTDNPLVQYVNKIFEGANQLGTMVNSNHTGLDYLQTYKTQLNTYISFIKSIFSALTVAKTLFTREGNNFYDLETVSQLMSTTIDSLFGWTTDGGQGFTSKNPDIFHEGVLQKVFGFLTSADEYETLFTEHSGALETFDGITRMITSFMEAVTQMAKADQTSIMFSQFHADYGTYVTQLAAVLKAILDNRQIFEDFFDFGKEFNSSYVSNIALMMTALNQIVQMVTTLHETGSITDTVLNSLQFENHWSRLFEIIQEDIIGDNKDFFSPQITPVLEISDDFKAKAAEMHQLLGFVQDENGQWITNPNLTIVPNLELPETHNYTDILERMEKVLNSIDTSTGSFNSSLSGLTIDMDGRKVGMIVAPYVSNIQGRRMLINSRNQYNGSMAALETEEP